MSSSEESDHEQTTQEAAAAAHEDRPVPEAPMKVGSLVIVGVVGLITFVVVRRALQRARPVTSTAALDPNAWPAEWAADPSAQWVHETYLRHNG